MRQLNTDIYGVHAKTDNLSSGYVGIGYCFILVTPFHLVCILDKVVDLRRIKLITVNLHAGSLSTY